MDMHNTRNLIIWYGNKNIVYETICHGSEGDDRTSAQEKILISDVSTFVDLESSSNSFLFTSHSESIGKLPNLVCGHSSVSYLFC